MMSLATEFAPSVPIPDAARLRHGLAAVPDDVPALFDPAVSDSAVCDPALSDFALFDGRRGARLAAVAVLRAPADTRSLRLTRRGVVLLSFTVVVLAAALVWVAAMSAPAETSSSTAGPDVVTVQSGDTLWSIAGRAAPGHDPRAEVVQLQRLNKLRGVALVPGQQLRVR